MNVAIVMTCVYPPTYSGNSTKFTAKSVTGAMEWVVAIKEAIRVQEEKAREEVRPTKSHDCGGALEMCDRLAG